MKPEPSQQSHTDNRKQGQRRRKALDSGHNVRPQNIGISQHPDDAYLPQRHYQRILQRGKKRRQISETGHNQTNVADHVCQPVNQIGLIPHIVSKGLFGVGIRTAGGRVYLR